MQRFSLSAAFVLGLVTCILLAASRLPPAIAEEASPSETEAWASSVVSFKPGAGTIGANFSDPANALGPVDGSIVSIGNAQTPSGPPADPTTCEAVLVVSFDRYRLMDGEGDDLIIYESAVGSLLEPVWVYLWNEDTGWRFLGKSAGGRDPMDISGAVEPSESFSRVALCDVPDGDTTIGATPGPDIDAIFASYTSRMGLVAQAQGPGWSIDLDPATGTRTGTAFTPLVEFVDLGFAPPTVFRFECREDDEVAECSSYLIIKASCGGNLTTRPSAMYIYPFLFPTLMEQPTLRDLQIGYREERFETLYAFCFPTPVRAAAATDEPISIFTLDEGGTRFDVADATWRFTLETPTATIYNAGANQFIAIHYPDSGESVVRVVGGSVEVDPIAPGEDPFTLSAGEQIVITDDGPGPVMDLDFLYLPVTQ